MCTRRPSSSCRLLKEGTDSESAKGALLPAIGMGSRIYLLLHRICLDAVTQIAIESQQQYHTNTNVDFQTKQPHKALKIHSFNQIKVTGKQCTKNKHVWTLKTLFYLVAHTRP